MTIKKYNNKEDYMRIIEFLKEQYEINKSMECWLPARFDDLVYRIDTLYHDDRGGLRSSDYIYIFEEDSKIVGVIFPDGASFNSAIRKGYESIFSTMIDIGEKELLPLFKKDENENNN